MYKSNCDLFNVEASVTYKEATSKKDNIVKEEKRNFSITLQFSCKV